MSAMAMPARPTLHLVDASLYIFRAWHSMPDEFRDADGWPTNAVHGFARFLLDLLERERPRHIAIAFDEALDSCFRNVLYPPYKANRDPAPEELRRQFRQCKALCAALGLVVLAHREYEADDLIGSALHFARPQGFRGLIVSADKDLSQLLADFADVLAMSRGGNLAGEPERLVEQAVKLDPKNLKALALLGTAAYERKDFARAAEVWARMLPLVPAGSEDARAIARDMGRIVARWREYARGLRLPEREVRALAPAFEHRSLADALHGSARRN